MGKVISFMNNKGGVGKTTSTHSIGLAFAKMGKKVLFIDLDSQANLTSILSDTDPLKQEWKTTIEESFLQYPDVPLPIQHTDNPYIDFVPSDLDLANFERDIARKSLREYLLADILQPVVDNYDYVFIDCPPAIQMITYNAILASDYLIFVTTLDGKSFKGIQMITTVYNDIMQNRRFASNVKVIGILATKFERDKVSRFYWDLLNKQYGALVIEPYIRKSTMVNRATSANQSIYVIDPTGKATDDYLRAAEDLLVRIEDDVRNPGGSGEGSAE